MRVVMVCPSYPPQTVTCGVGDYTRCLATELARQGATVTIVTSGEWRGQPPSSRITVLPLFPDAAWWRVMPADVVHVQYAPDLYPRRGEVALLPVRARLRGAPPLVVTFHTLLDGTAAGRALALWLLSASAATISANEVVTGMVRRRLPAWLAGRLTEIPIGSNIAPAPAADRAAVLLRLALPVDTQLIAHFGLVYPGKGLETLLDALVQVRRRHPRARLVIVGDTRPEDRAYRAGLQAQAERLGQRGAVAWTGRMADADASGVLGAADLFVAPFDEGASIRRGSLMAGLAHGCAVVSTRPPRPSEWLRDGEALALVVPRDAAALAERTIALLDDP
ncbi:MAG TPA: glycosyltransferase, partial [Candidatus Limnocylindria bacterium]|nr:glycosyltransferase [Candidatus Limnocylindria bacterium]